jgi:hypothetical protein
MELLRTVTIVDCAPMHHGQTLRMTGVVCHLALAGDSVYRGGSNWLQVRYGQTFRKTPGLRRRI